MVSYADFITLLFAFFVVMYGMSSISQTKYEELAKNLAARFRQAPVAAEPAPSESRPAPAEVGPLRRPASTQGIPGFLQGRFAVTGSESAAGASASADANALERTARRLRSNLDPLIEQGRFRVRRSGSRIEIEIQSGVLFPSGSARPGDAFVEPLQSVARVIRDRGQPVRVEGFTDDVPVRGGRYASNWELSAARAARVVRLFGELGIDPGRMAAVGYGEHRPIADNGTADGRARIRRVVIVVGRAASPVE
jgi:chemotaxis protein MotB